MHLYGLSTLSKYSVFIFVPEEFQPFGSGLMSRNWCNVVSPYSNMWTNLLYSDSSIVGWWRLSPAPHGVRIGYWERLPVDFGCYEVLCELDHLQILVASVTEKDTWLCSNSELVHSALLHIRNALTRESVSGDSNWTWNHGRKWGCWGNIGHASSSRAVSATIAIKSYG